ncbi:NIPSNAP family protein [Roseomonas sp. AR75]|jgi:hypothetical protein|uniref:NIPSNAP family protein n=1 Tax=Roseomonas sp. AR75 TaxID=2562311 RepID=UPI0010C0C033|nr:NIPSNAP family protein [Roseomonas sp. AR75]
MIYELATLSTAIGGAGAAAQAIPEWCRDGEAKGRLLGMWNTDIGALNTLVVLRGFGSPEEVHAERQRALMSSSPFNGGSWLTAMTLDTYAPLSWLPPVETGAFGPVYELRSYAVRPHGLTPLIEAWRTQLPDRLPHSKLLVAMYTVDGPTRFTHLWPYASTNDRAAIRAEAVKGGKWPPKGGQQNLFAEDMRSWICLPLPGSPLT